MYQSDILNIPNLYPREKEKVSSTEEKAQKEKPQRPNGLQCACSPAEGENFAQHVVHQWTDIIVNVLVFNMEAVGTTTIRLRVSA